MQALLLEQPRSFRFIDIPEPEAPGPGAAVVRVRAVGICGTDYGGYLGKMPFFSYPRIPGHELGVEVVAVGAGVTHVKPGDSCCVEPYINCQTCHSCRRGLTNCCEHHQTLGVHCDGGLRPLFTVPARKLHPAAGLSSAQAALVETLAIGCHAVDRAAPTAAETVLVIGAGPIGLSVVEFAKLSGARVVVADVAESRLSFVRERMGVTDTVTVTAGDAALAAVTALTGGRMAEVVVDATGSAASMSAALGFAAFGGRLVYVGITQDALTFPHAPVLHRRELSILASRNALSRDFTRIIRLIAEGTIDTRPWITHHIPFADTSAAFPALLQPASGVIKAVVDMP
ncbi:MAG: zinc-binding alcohol dehydrogenase family protein [Planctomycetota bacterium]|jgi:alcohol dehydrogenase|nr:MAG: zinc-binding alcohol dehydrogenase family protein [Planctomycetota bacterium]